MNAQRQKTFDLALEAAQWLGRLQESATAENPAFMKWLTASPLHVQAFLNVSAVAVLLSKVDPEKRIDAERLVRESVGNVSALRPTPALRLQGRRGEEKSKRWKLAVAAGIAVVVLGGAWMLHVISMRANTWSTAIGEQLTVELDDGSIVNLNSRSQVQVRFSQEARDVLLEGEAMFKVRRDPIRPFRVYSGDAMIQAVGTQFNVHRLPSGTIVSVIEGVVQVSRQDEPKVLKLTAREEARVRRTGSIEKRPLSEAADGAAWRQHRLTFSDDRLEDIAAEFNRWNREQIRVEDANVAARLYSGAFDADDAESFIAFLERDPGLMVQEQGRDIIVRPANR
jgi:transmembrane sensor